jgi:hypothetical protein
MPSIRHELRAFIIIKNLTPVESKRRILLRLSYCMPYYQFPDLRITTISISHPIAFVSRHRL